MANTSTVHIKTDFDCKVFDYDQEIGMTKADTYTNFELRKGEHELTFVYYGYYDWDTVESFSKTINYIVNEANCDYKLSIRIAEIILEKAEQYEACFFQTNNIYADTAIKAYHAYLDAAEKGEAQSQYHLGEMLSDHWNYGELTFYGCKERYEHGINEEKDIAKAVDWFAKAAVQGHAKAQYRLGDCYYYGNGVEKNLIKAVEWYKKAADQGNTDALYSLGYCYYHGQGVKEDLNKAAKWYNRAAVKGNKWAQHALGDCYYCGNGVEEDWAKAVKWYTKAAEQGIAEAQYSLGVCYYRGEGVDINYNKAAEWHTKAADQGNTDAQCSLGVCFYYGEGVEKDHKKAIELFSKAAKHEDNDYDFLDDPAQMYLDAVKGDAGSQFILGELYWIGQFVEKNEAKAIGWYTKAAEQGDAAAQFILGIHYANGDGVEKNPKKAIELIYKAANQKLKEALWYLGCYYFDGECVKQNLEKAIKWFNDAIKHGADQELLKPKFWELLHKEEKQHDALAQFNIGYWLEHAWGTDEDIQEAIKWYTKAAAQGNEYAQEALDRLRPNKTKPIKYLFFDTETTGIPKDYNAPTSDSRNWPRLVQLSWITTDGDCNNLSENDYIIYPDGFVIPSDAAKLHGITTKIAKDKGWPLEVVLERFSKDFNAADTIVGHNIAFDKKIVGAELIRLGQKDIMNSKKSLCTMESATDFCKIPGYHGYKWPKLQELHKKLFGYEFEDAHNSMSDVTATLECFKEMRKRGLI